MPTLVFARPDHLHRFRATAHGAADGLEVRRRALGDAVDRYRARTEPTFEVDCAGADEAVHAVVLAVRQLGAWVGAVGDAFEAIGVSQGDLDGVFLAAADRLADALPAALRVVDGAGPRRPAMGEDEDDDGFDLADGLTIASAAGAGLRRSEMRALASVVGRDGAAGRALGAASESPRVPGLARFLDLTAALRAGGGEAANRWEAEPDRPPVERAGRAALDGLLAGGGSYGGAAGGAWLGATLCAPSLIGIPPCASAGSYAGGWLGGRAAEWLSDRILGPEPDPPGPDRDEVAAEVGDVDGAVLDVLEPVVADAADDASEAGARHADFVLDHPWLWDDDHADAPHHEPPPPTPVLPRTGPA
jgi:hypothetical protein